MPRQPRIEYEGAIYHLMNRGDRREDIVRGDTDRIVLEGLSEAGWDADRLRDERKGHPTKVKLARRLRRETTMTLQWIAESLCMGSWTYVSNLLRPNAVAQGCVKDKD